MSDTKNNLIGLLDQYDILDLKRLYKIEIYKKIENPAAQASGSGAEAPKSNRFSQNQSTFFSSKNNVENAGYLRLYVLMDISRLSTEEILVEIEGLINKSSGEYKIEVYYWDGEIRDPALHNHEFSSNYNPTGFAIKKIGKPIYIKIS